MNFIIYWFLIATSLIDRLHCPKCLAVGTYKIHPPCQGGAGDRRPWRWLCKWCGYYRAPDGEGMLCYPSTKAKAWSFKIQAELGETTFTPQEVIEAAYGYPLNPWNR